MPINSVLISKMLSPQRSWSKDDAFDAVFALRLVVALVMGMAFGATGSEGFLYFIAFLITTFFGAKTWLEWQNIDVEQMEAVNSSAGDSAPPSPSLLTEGLGPSIPLFMVSSLIGC
jgi:ABC-type nickel/cobalt efflux system permease component RcnA